MTAGSLPPIQPVSGPLSVRVQYPGRGQRIAAVDSNFVFGSVGTGDATLIVNGAPVPVEPNGAFIAWLPVPPRDADGTATYLLVARRAGAADSLRHAIRLPDGPFVGAETPWLDPATLRDTPVRWALPDEDIEFRTTAAPDLDVWLDAGGERFFLVEQPADDTGDATAPAVATYRTRVAARYLWEAVCRTAVWADSGVPTCGEETRDPETQTDSLPVTIRAAAGWDTVQVERYVRLRLLSPESLPVFTLREAPDEVNGLSGVVVGRPTPAGTYRWQFPNGSRVVVDGRRNDRLRAHLTSGLHAWVPAEDAMPVPDAEAGPGLVRDLRVEPQADRLEIRVGLTTAVPLEVHEPDPYTLQLTLFGALGITDRVAYGMTDDLLDSINWEQLPGDRYRLSIRLTRPIWGYRTVYEQGAASEYEGPRAASNSPGAAAGNAGAARPAFGQPVLRIDVRRPPRIDASRPLRGRRIAVDPGHPGGGSRGPTGFFEGDANLAIAQRLVQLLRAEGAVPVLVRPDGEPVGLYERTRRAREAGAEVFVSIHNNALPDGVRPFGREGTSTYYYHPHSLELARAVQEGMLSEMRLRDLGTLWGNLAVARDTWMPAVLAEGAFMMMPQHEAALKTAEFQGRYARGVMLGLEAFLRSRAP
jgi:N-acetylmuramoyl-L-alanine amidase